MNTAELLDALDGVTVLSTTPVNTGYIVVGVALLALCIVGIFVMANVKSNVDIAVAAGAILSLIFGMGLLLTGTVSYYVVEIADDAPPTTIMVLTQNFETVEIDGNFYTLQN